MRDGQIPLPRGVTCVLRHQAVEDCQVLRERRLRLRQFALSLENITHPAIRRGQILLAPRVARVLLSQPADDGQILPNLRLRLFQLALGLPHTADPASWKRRKRSLGSIWPSS